MLSLILFDIELMAERQRLTYSLTTLPLIIEDIERRNRNLMKLHSLLQKKIKLDISHSQKIEALLRKQGQFSEVERTSQNIFTHFLNVFNESSKKVRLATQKSKQQTEGFIKFLQRQSLQTKRLQQQAKNMSNILYESKSKVDKLFSKYYKKNKQMETVKGEYLNSYFGKQGMHKKNQIYLSIRSIQGTVGSLREEYQSMNDGHNQQLGSRLNKFWNVLEKIEMGEVRKLYYFKRIVKENLQNSIDSLSETLRITEEGVRRVNQTTVDSDFNPHNAESVQIEKASLTISFQNQSQFIYSIYNQVEPKLILNQIIAYGDNKDYKKAINILIGVEEGIFEADLKEECLRIGELFRQIIHHDFHIVPIQELEKLLQKRDETRKDFLSCFLKYLIANQFCIPRDFFIKIEPILMMILNICEKQRDVINSKQIMQISLLCYFMSEGNKIQLSEVIKRHRIFKSIGWWKAALFVSIFEQSRCHSNRNDSLSEWEIKAGGQRRKQDIDELSYQNICLKQVMEKVHCMVQWNISAQSIIQFAEYCFNLFKINERMAEEVLSLIKKH